MFSSSKEVHDKGKSGTVRTHFSVKITLINE